MVRSVQKSGDFLEGSGTPRDGRRGKRKHDGVRIFSRISTMAPGIQLILPGDFQEGAWPVSGCQCANPWTKVRYSGVQSPVSDDESPVHSGQQRLYHAVRRPVQNGVGVVCGRGRNPTLRLWPAIFSGEIDVFPSERRNMGQEIGR